MDEAQRLRQLATQCRNLAARLHARTTAETLLDMAGHFEASARTSEHLPAAQPPAAAERVN
ncbi:MAG TPA: hypothetical protein VF704_05430 [Allosphingosinicella sp.]|jgi:hypothetical protein